MSLRYFKCRDLKVYYVSLCLLVKVVLWFQIHYALLKSSQNSEIENVTGVGCDIHLHKHNNFLGGKNFVSGIIYYQMMIYEEMFHTKNMLVQKFRLSSNQRSVLLWYGTVTKLSCQLFFQGEKITCLAEVSAFSGCIFHPLHSLNIIT